MNQIGAIQILRAVAALLVVFSHGQNDALVEALKNGVPFTRSTLLPWDAGVDLFFVISGFIMVFASERLFATKGAPGEFLGRRLIRIVPLYWLMTVLALLLIGGAAWLGRRSFPSWAEIGTSLVFFPYPRGEDGIARPVVTLGWTLNYEMFFYVVFSLFLRFRRDFAVLGVTAALASVVVLGAIVHPQAAALAYWSDPIVLEFVLGMWLAVAWRHGVRLDAGTAVPLGLAGIVALALDLDGMTAVDPTKLDNNGLGRLLAYGLPMAAVFAATVLTTGRQSPRGRILTFAALVGDASYALYLFHPFAVILSHKIYVALGLPHAIGFWPLVAIELPMAIALALIVHLKIEKPVSERLNAWFKHHRAHTSVKPLLVEPRPS